MSHTVREILAYVVGVGGIAIIAVTAIAGAFSRNH